MHLTRNFIESVITGLIKEKDLLTQLDIAIGDGDHGANIERGCQAVQAIIEELVEIGLPQAIQKAGFVLIMNMGGASGPLYGTLLLNLGKQLPENPSFSDFAEAFETAVQAVKIRGRSDFGQKSILDVLIPMSQLFVEKPAPWNWKTVSEFALECASKTIVLEAKVGRAAFLGKRSIGHVDPGAYSCALMICQICELLEDSL